MGEEEEDGGEPQYDPGAHPIFVDSIDQYAGEAIAKSLVESGYPVYGTSVSGENPVAKVQLLNSRKEGIEKCEYVVFEQLEDASAAKEALDLISKMTLHKKRTLIIFSTLLTWGERIKEKEEDEDAAQPEPEGEPPEPPDEDEEPDAGPPINEEEYLKRHPLDIAGQQYAVEGRALQLAEELKERLRVFIFGVGLLYGAGEHVFRPFFRALWEGKADAFPCSQAHVPVFNVGNLGLVVKKVTTTPPPEDESEIHPPYYILAESAAPTLRTVGRTFSKLLADGAVAPVAEFTMPEIHQALLTTNLPAESSYLQDEDEEAIHFAGGIIESAWRVVDEFKALFAIEPLKILITGPPGAPLEELGRRISADVGVTFVNPPDVLKAAESESSEFGEEIRGVIQNDGVTDETVVRVVHRELQTRNCRNYGWVVVGFVDSVERAALLFDISEQEDVSPHFKFIPNRVVGFDEGDEELEARAAALGEDKEGFRKALRKYRRVNTAEKNWWQFFDDREIAGIIVPRYDDIPPFLGARRDFGRPIEEIEAERAEIERVIQERAAKEAVARQAELDGQVASWQEGGVLHGVAVRRVAEQQHAILVEESAKLETYLNEKVVPDLAAVLSELIVERPEDPIRALAAKLFVADRQWRG